MQVTRPARPWHRLLRRQSGALTVEFVISMLLLVGVFSGSLALVGIVLEEARMQRTASHLAEAVSYTPHDNMVNLPANAAGLRDLVSELATLPPERFVVYIHSARSTEDPPASASYRFEAERVSFGSLAQDSQICAGACSGGMAVSAVIYPDAASSEYDLRAVEFYWRKGLLGSEQFLGDDSIGSALRWIDYRGP